MAEANQTATVVRPLPGELLADILAIVGELNSVLDLDALLGAIAQQIRRILDYEILDVFLPEPDGGLRPALALGYGEVPAHFHLEPGVGIVGAAATERRVIFVPDVSRDPRYVSFVHEVVAELAIPLVHNERVVGVLNIEGRDASAFTPEVRTALQVLAGHLAVALENATLYQQTRRYAGLLATLYEVGKEMTSILEPDALLSRIAEIVKRVIDYEMFGILLLDPATGDLVLRKSVRFRDTPEKPRVRPGQGLTGWAAVTKEPVLVGDVRKDPRYLELIPQTRSELVVPLIHKDRVVGVFDLESTEPDRFTEDHVQVLIPLASQVAVALENARLYEELRTKEDRLQRELALARRVQRGLFPEECPAGEGWEASAHFLPALELGGDLYDFYETDPGKLGLAIGDVTGKGVPAALYGAFASGTVRARAYERRTPGALMTRANRTLRHRGVERHYCTLAYALFDFPARQMRLANSGLPYPLHYRAATGRTEPLEVAGLPLGAFEGTSYEERLFELTAGDVFVFFTDGLPEATNGAEDYGAARLARAIERHAALPATRLGEQLIAGLREFTGEVPLADDVTLVVVKVL